MKFLILILAVCALCSCKQQYKQSQQAFTSAPEYTYQPQTKNNDRYISQQSQSPVS